MTKRRKIMVAGAIVMAIGIVVIIVGYDKYLSMADAFRGAGEIIAFAEEKGTPPGVIETTVGILVVAIGIFIGIYGFGQMEGNKKLQETK